MSDDYEFVAKSSLKLKKTDGMVVKAKKKKKKNKIQGISDNKFKQMIEKLDNHSDSSNDYTGTQKTDKSSKEFNWMTPAQKKFLEQQEQRETERIMTKASKSHKQRVEEFNSHLENLSEHYDIPKVSWTK